MEPVDIYDKDRNKTGIIKYRGRDTYEEGEYVVVTDALLINSKKQILISKRAESKLKYPGYWEINGGCSKAGETSLDAIVREIKEELGITLNPNEGILLKTVQYEFKLKDIWLFKIDKEIEELKFLDGEVSDAKWVSFEEYKDLLEKDLLVDVNSVVVSCYEKAINLLNIS